MPPKKSPKPIAKKRTQKQIKKGKRDSVADRANRLI